jgi:hypothetical protein
MANRREQVLAHHGGVELSLHVHNLLQMFRVQLGLQGLRCGFSGVELSLHVHNLLQTFQV